VLEVGGNSRQKNASRPIKEAFAAGETPRGHFLKPRAEKERYMEHNFLVGDQVCFIQEVDRQDPFELPDWLPPIPAGTMGRIEQTAENSVLVRIAHPRDPRRNALLRLYAEDGKLPHCPIRRKPWRPLPERLPQRIAIFSGHPGDILNLTPEERAAVEKFWSASV